MKIHRLSPLGEVLETLELKGRFFIDLRDTTYFMCEDYIEEIKPNLEKMQTNFVDNLR